MRAMATSVYEVSIVRTRYAAEPVAQRSVLNQSLQTGYKRRGIFAPSEKTVFAVANQLRHAALVRADDGSPRRHRFQTRIWAVFP